MKKEQPETEQAETQKEDGDARRKRQAGQALQKHFMAHPHGVIIASISGNKIECDVTEFKDMGALLFAQKLMNEYVDEAFRGVLLRQKEQMAAMAKAGPQAVPSEEQPQSGAV